MDEENKNDQATDNRVFVDALSDGDAAGKQQDNAMPPVNEQKPDPMPPVNTQQSSPMPPINTQQSSPMPPVNTQQSSPMPPVNTQQSNPMPPVNTQQNNAMPPVNNQSPMGQPVNQGPFNNQAPVNQGPFSQAPVNQAPVQQQNSLFSGPPQQEPKKKKKGGGIIIALLIVLLVLAGAAVGILFGFGIIGPKKEIQLSKTSVKLDKGDEIVIKVENYEDELEGIYLMYESEDPKIAKIKDEYDDAFIIQGKKKGKTTVTVSGKGCETITISVTVKD